jgi:hypothetical protein
MSITQHLAAAVCIASFFLYFVPSCVYFPLTDKERIISRTRQNRSAEAIALIEALGHDAQRDVLAAPGRKVVSALAYGGQADATMALIEALNPVAQREVLTSLSAVLGLAYNGQAQALINLIETLDHGAQRDVLSAPYNTIPGLASNGQARAVIEIRNSTLLESKSVLFR